MIYAIFTYSEDEAMLRMCSARVHQLDKDAKIYAVNDARSPIKSSVPGVHMLSSSYNRGGNLNGLENLGAQLAIFQQLLAREKADYIIKLDADSWANDLSPFLVTEAAEGKSVPDYLATENWEAYRPSGHLYRLSRWLVDKLVAMYNERTARHEWPQRYNYPEDQSIFRMACMTRLPMELIPHTSGYSVGMFDGGPGTNEACLTAGIVHCGEPDKNGKRVSRSHATLRMRLLAAECGCRS